MNGNITDQVHDDRIFWTGPFFGRLPKSGREFLLKNGWKELYEDPLGFLEGEKSRIPEHVRFIWPSKSGPQFEMMDHATSNSRPQIMIRPFPISVTSFLDDKISLAELLQGHGAIAPRVIFSPKESHPNKRYFVKHRHGVQGKSVYVYNKLQLQEWWNRCQNRNDFVVQEEVLPALDEHGRKFVLRAHVLLLQKGNQGGKAATKAFLHKDVICLPHASPYVGTGGNASRSKSADVSQAGKKHPSPILIRDLPSDHPAASSWSRIQQSCQNLVALAVSATTKSYASNPFQQQIGKHVTCFALLGLDLLISQEGLVQICEVNSHPALGWGTMKIVPKVVFKRLIDDTLAVVVLDTFSESNNFEGLSLGIRDDQK